MHDAREVRDTYLEKYVDLLVPFLPEKVTKPFTSYD